MFVWLFIPCSIYFSSCCASLNMPIVFDVIEQTCIITGGGQRQSLPLTFQHHSLSCRVLLASSRLTSWTGIVVLRLSFILFFLPSFLLHCMPFLSVCLSVCLSIYLSVCLSVFLSLTNSAAPSSLY